MASHAAEFKSKYDEDMYIDDADRAYMSSLTEKDREQVLVCVLA